jgi:glycosyltransferase involved in cell wall biosynthesis
MNVWINSSFDNLPQEGYRAQRYWLMSEAFARAGHCVVYWTGDFSHAGKAKRKFIRPLDNDTAVIKLIPTPAYRTNVSLMRVWSHRVYAERWKKLAVAAVDSRELPPPDLIVVSMPTLSSAAAALELGGRFGARTVVDMMDAWPDTFHRLVPKPIRFLAPFFFGPLHRKARSIYRNADLVSGVCRSYAKMIAGFGVENFHLAYHGIDMSGAVPRRSRPDGGVLKLVYAGNLGRTYDLETVLKAVASDRNTTLDIAGAGPLEPKWKQLVSELDLAERVRFHGYLDAESLSDLFSRCELGVIPMSADSFVGLPYKLCDYVKAGLGVVSSLEGECNSFVTEHGVGVEYIPGDVDSFLKALDRWRELSKGGSCGAYSAMRVKLDSNEIYRKYVAALDIKGEPV